MPLTNDAFAECARQFCKWAESGVHDVETGRKLILTLMLNVSWLVAQDSENGKIEYPSRTYKDWETDHKRFSVFPFQYYRQIFSPIDLNEEAPVTGDVHDDLADIYGDLWHGLQALDRGDRAYALNYWRESYFQHWGHHAAGAIFAIDEYYRNTKND